MSRGGARNRSGPPADLNSARSDRRGLANSVRVLPAEGYKGKVPEWPMPKGSPRERALWRKLWKTPQAVVWAEESWRWHTIGLYIRCLVRAEAPDAPPSALTPVLRMADNLGLSTAGLRENGWVISSETEGDQEPATPPTARTPAPRRLRAVNES